MADTIITQAVVEVVSTQTPPVQATQVVAEILHGEFPPPPLDVRVSQLPIEVLTQSDPLVWTTQSVAEILHGSVLPPPPEGVYITHLPIELLTHPPNDLRVTQFVVEVLALGSPPMRTSQLITEVVTGRPLPMVSLEIAGDFIGLTWVEWTLTAPAMPTHDEERGMMRVGRRGPHRTKRRRPRRR